MDQKKTRNDKQKRPWLRYTKGEGKGVAFDSPPPGIKNTKPKKRDDKDGC